MHDPMAKRKSLNAENSIGAGGGLLLSGSDISIGWRLLGVLITIKLWVATCGVAQDHEEGIASELSRLGRRMLGPPLFMHLHLANQLTEEEPRLDTRDLLLAG